MNKSELSLLIVDFGESGCVITCEKGRLELPKEALYMGTGTLQLLGEFPRIREAIDAHFAEDKPIPRIETTIDGLELYSLPSLNGWFFQQKDLDALNELARQAGATKDLPIYEPKGKWTQIYPTGSYNVWIEQRSDAEVPVAKVAGVSKYPCKIWRYER